MGPAEYRRRAGARLRRLVLDTPLLLLAGCLGSMSPLSNRVKVGEEPYLVFVADGEAGGADLFVSRADGGTVFPITFTRLDERTPALSPDGGVVAFVRSSTPGDSETAAVWVMNLLNGAERRLTEPGAVVASRLAWSVDGGTLYARTAGGVMLLPAPPSASEARAATGPEALAGDSALAVLLGDPPIARALPCADGTGLCSIGASGVPDKLAEGARDPLRWGVDSLAYFIGDELVVRPLGGGRTRTLNWVKPPPHARDGDYFPGNKR